MLAALEGDRGANDAHYLRALEYAQQAGDVLQLIRVRTNRGSRHVEECSYEEAVAELDLALGLADLAGFAAFRALALTNRGEALFRLGRLDEAVADLEAGQATSTSGSARAWSPTRSTSSARSTAPAASGRSPGPRSRRRSATARRRATCRRSSRPSPAWRACSSADEPDAAAALVERALACPPGMNQVHALLAAGWVELARGDRCAATGHAAAATAAAGVRRDRASLAESLELRVLAAPEPVRQADRLEEAVGIWRDLRNPAAEARARAGARAARRRRRRAPPWRTSSSARSEPRGTARPSRSSTRATRAAPLVVQSLGGSACCAPTRSCRSPRGSPGRRATSSRCWSRAAGGRPRATR